MKILKSREIMYSDWLVRIYFPVSIYSGQPEVDGDVTRYAPG